MIRRGMAAAGVAGFAAALVCASVGWWLAAGLLVQVPVFAAGWWACHCSHAAEIAASRRDVADRDVRINALEDERDSYYARRAAYRWADDARLMPDNGAGYRSATAGRDDSSAVPAASRPAGLPSPSI